MRQRPAAALLIADMEMLKRLEGSKLRAGPLDQYKLAHLIALGYAKRTREGWALITFAGRKYYHANKPK